MFPHTIRTAMVSPIARVMARTAPAQMPRMATGNTAERKVATGPRPSALAAISCVLGTDSNAERQASVMVGTIIKPKTMMPANTLCPTGCQELMIGTTHTNPQSPNTTDGTPANNSMKRLRNVATQVGAKNLAYTAVKKPTGPAHRVAPIATRNEPHKSGVIRY